MGYRYWDADDPEHPFLTVRFVEKLGAPRDRLEKLSKALREATHDETAAIDSRLAAYFADRFDGFLSHKYTSLEQALDLMPGQGNQASAEVEARDRKLAKKIHPLSRSGQSWKKILDYLDPTGSLNISERTVRRAYEKFGPALLGSEIAKSLSKPKKPKRRKSLSKPKRR